MNGRDVVLILLVLATIQGQICRLKASNIGVNYEISGDYLPPPGDVVALFKKYKIDNVRLFDPNPAALNALKGSGIKVILGIKNEDIGKLSSIKSAKAWLDVNVKPYIRSINFSVICVGNEAIPGSFSKSVLSAIQTLQSVVGVYNYTGIKVTTVVSTSVLTTFNPPSASEFKKEVKSNMATLITTLMYSGATLLIKAYPYYEFIADPVKIRQDYALFTAAGPIVKDGTLSYQNLLDAFVDSFYWAIEKLHLRVVECIVAESGWPYDGNGYDTSDIVAHIYNGNFRKRILSNAGTPKRPKTPLKGFIYSMFNNYQRPFGVEQHFGMFYPNGEPIYAVF